MSNEVFQILNSISSSLDMEYLNHDSMNSRSRETYLSGDQINQVQAEMQKMYSQLKRVAGYNLSFCVLLMLMIKTKKNLLMPDLRMG
jgi:hypothetical protein